MKKTIISLLKQPWFYILCAILFLIFVLHPISDSPEILYSFLPESWYYDWENFVVMDMKFTLYRIGFVICLTSIVFGAYSAFKRNPLKENKAGKVIAYLLLALFAFLNSMPPFGCAWEKDRRISCSCNLKQLFQSLQEYANDYEQNLPPKLKTLSDTDYMTDEGLYRCPSQWRERKNFSDYLYLGAGRKINEKIPFVLLRDRDKNHPGRYKNILMSDGKIISSRK